MTLSVRPAKEEDQVQLLQIDHGYSTEYVWQMDLDQDGPQRNVHFRETRLPRPMDVAYPRSIAVLEKEWATRAAHLIAEEDGGLLGYIALAAGPAPLSCWTTDLVVSPVRRRQGLGSKLVLAAQVWAHQRGFQRLILEMQSKNHPAIRFAQKLAFDFSGYSDRYYENQDIALFFAKKLS
jgi:GNAT superfamily N-acetyltransferase